jgi:hypothetical protein
MTDKQLLQQILDTVTRIEARQTLTGAAVGRIEAKQDVLVGALADDSDPHLGQDSRPLEPSDPK